jgi:glycolate oxidase FAD binding subunit
MQEDSSAQLQEAVRVAARDGKPLAIRGGGSKAFYGHEVAGSPLETGAHRGVVNYAPTELVITARAGTPLRAIEQTLAEQGQMLGFEPPHFGAGATLGGTIACNLSGPRRPYSGAARDFVLGCRLINGNGEILAFGGEVMKNVAGYDVSRLMAGSLGTLGVLLEVSLKVLPAPETESTLVFECDAALGLARMNEWSGLPLPLSATCHDGENLHVRLSGAGDGIRAARKRIGGEEQAQAGEWWRRIREHRHGFFAGERPLWRVSVAPTAPPLPLSGKWLYDWGGAQRWLLSDEPAARIRAVVAGAGGHATLYRGDRAAADVFHPLPDELKALHRRLKEAFDPGRILNYGRMYRGI